MHHTPQKTYYECMGYGTAYKLAAPSLEGCDACGQNITNCQCLRFDKNAPRDGTTMADLSLNDPLKSFFYYAAPLVPQNSNRAPSSISAKASSNQSDNDGLGMPAGFSSTGSPSGGPAF